MVIQSFPHLLNICFCPQAPTPLQGAENLHLGVLALGEALVLTAPSSRAHRGVTLIQQHAVDAFRVDATRVLIGGFTVATGDFRQVRGEDLHPAYWAVHLGNRHSI